MVGENSHPEVLFGVVRPVLTEIIHDSTVDTVEKDSHDLTLKVHIFTGEGIVVRGVHIIDRVHRSLVP